MEGYDVAFLYGDRSAVVRLSQSDLHAKTFLDLYKLARPLVSIDLPPDQLYTDVPTSESRDVTDLSDSPIDAGFLLECPIVSFIPKAHYEEFDRFLSTSFPSLLAAATEFSPFQAELIHHINLIQATFSAATSPRNATTLKKLIPGRTSFGALLDWFSYSRFLTADFAQPICPHCRKRMINEPNIRRELSESELSRGAFEATIYECPRDNCGLRIRLVRYLEADVILESGKGKSVEASLLLGAALTAFGLQFRIVGVPEQDRMWVEVWVGDAFVIVDPQDVRRTEAITADDARWVIAFGRYECVDLTAKYVNPIAETLAARNELFPEPLFQKIIALRDGMLRNTTDEEKILEVTQRQNADIETWWQRSNEHRQPPKSAGKKP
jgi:hypothetical protein